MKYFFYLLLILVLLSCKNNTDKLVEGFIELPQSVLVDKIKGGWAGQVIGVTYGGPTEFYYKGTIIQSYTPIPWNDSIVKWWYNNSPGLYDDVYMDLSFVEVFERCGLNASVDSFATSFAKADYHLWHANQQARYNIMHGIKPPLTGQWQNNPHADCIDFQIEADFAGLMCPGMVNSSSEICDKIGHIMNSGDGWYGGVYVAAMYSLAFISEDVDFILTEALKTIPPQSTFYQCINDVINWHKQYPKDWKECWYLVQNKWSEDIGCPKGVYDSYNIDAKINAAYVVIGLLYGNKDFGKTIDIATRCGQDSDCNPATAGGILGTIIGYSKIPDYWKKPLLRVQNIDFTYTSTSLVEVYDICLKHALEMIKKNGGSIQEEKIKIHFQKPKIVAFEQNFSGLFPTKKIDISNKNSEKDSILFKGNACVITGWISNSDGKVEDLTDFIVQLELKENDNCDTLYLPASMITRKADIYFNYNLIGSVTNIKWRWLNPDISIKINFKELLVYKAKN